MSSCDNTLQATFNEYLIITESYMKRNDQKEMNWIEWQCVHFCTTIVSIQKVEIAGHRDGREL